MLEKTMIKVMNKKIEDWLRSIKDPIVVGAIRKDLIITGGCITSFIQNESPNDYDCYFRTIETTELVAEYYVGLWNNRHGIGKGNREATIVNCKKLRGEESPDVKEEYIHKFLNSPFYEDRIYLMIQSSGVIGDLDAIRSDEELGVDSTKELIDEFSEQVEEIDESVVEEVSKAEKDVYFPVFISGNAITLSDKIQLIVRFFGEPSDIHDTFDYEHTMAYYDFGKKILEVPKKTYELVTNKTLVYSGSKYPVCSIFRMRKFINRGWKINAGQMLKMCLQVSELDLYDIDVLEDQLVGVDSLYFNQLLIQFAKAKENNTDFKLTGEYLISVINKIF